MRISRNKRAFFGSFVFFWFIREKHAGMVSTRRRSASSPSGRAKSPSENKKAGKKKMRQFGNVPIPPEAFVEVVKL